MTRVESLKAAAPSGFLVGVSPLGNAAVAMKRQQESGAEGVLSLHVLVVDDDEAVRRACCDVAAAMWGPQCWGRRAWRRRGRS